MKVHFPMQFREEGFTDAHKELIKYASQYGDVTIGVAPKFLDWGNYLLNGVDYGIEEEVKKISSCTSIVKDANELKATIRFLLPFKKLESERLLLLKATESVVKPYEEKLLLDRYVKLAKIHIMSRSIFRDGFWKAFPKIDVSLRGPEILNFFVKEMNRILPSLYGTFPEVVIFPRIIEDKDTGLKLGGSLGSISAYHKKELNRLPGAIGGFKDRCLIGTNEVLVKEINYSYTHKSWKITDISIFESDFVGGRLEVVGVSVPSSRGIALLEDIKYYPK